ncbi:MAG: hypothetical protein A2Y62_14355 [Candidatus Fischerbacteria bacterium RBG_13_37_8]|uniref:Tryptophan synthase beta chain-like PALP domain-containing protein n=1 Tax=Candidatus Fischerbacteria bacterium RBG_13_37_8 TaxID=1817863 RepID=A0A1F5VNK9_9BACT|nr:MAG: hypothetical protein A2Y62_14355 [Candidatus Fischerbacteria bacterium RBG_13_37_8]
MAESIKAGAIIEMESNDTLSDATAGGIEPHAITFDLCRQYVDDFFIVTEGEIAHAMNLIKEHHNMNIEGAAALTVASLIKHQSLFTDEKIALILSGTQQLSQ